MSDIKLRDTTAEDLDRIFTLENDAEAARQMNFPLRTREQFMRHWNEKILGAPDTISKVVLVDGEVAGNIGCWDADGERFIGYWFGRRYWGRGIGTTAVRAFVEAVGYRPLYADPALRNTGSVRLLEKCGFTRVGSEMVPNHYGEGEVEHVMLKLD